MVEHAHAEGLSARVDAEIRLEAEVVDGRDMGLHSVEGSARFGNLGDYVAPSALQYQIQGA